MNHSPLKHRSPFSFVFNLFHHDTKPANNNQDFLNSVIHELKTPLNAIIAFSDALKEGVNGPHSAEECADYANEISKAANEMNELIHDLLDVGSVASGNFSVDLSQEIDVSNLISRSIKLNYDFALKRGIGVKNEIASDVRPIKLDMKRMKQIMVNLISNSIKYSPNQTEIKVSAKTVLLNCEEYLQIVIADQGFGMTESQVAAAFEKYQTISNPNSKEVDSFGMGLPIAKRLIELQHGQIEVQSLPNKGTEMILNFPYKMMMA